MAVAAGSRAVGTKSCRSCPATCRSAVVVVGGVVGASVGDVVFDPPCLIENLNHGLSSFHPRLAQISSFSRSIAPERVYRGTYKATRSQARLLRTKVSPSNFSFHSEADRPADGNERPGQPTKHLLSPRKRLVSKPKFYTPGGMQRRSNSKRLSRHTTNGMSSKPIPRLPPMVLSLLIFWTERAKRTLRPSPPRSSRGGKTRLQNMQYLYPRFAGSLKRRCSR